MNARKLNIESVQEVSSQLFPMPLLSENLLLPRDPRFKLVLRIGELRRQQGLTQLELASALGLKANTIQKWENGTLVAEQIERLLIVCKVLDCQLPDLIESVSSKSLSAPTKHISKIAQLRQKKGFAQAELAAHIGVTKNTIQNWEKSQSGFEKIVKIQLLCQVLNCQLKDLVEYLPDNAQKSLASTDISPYELRQKSRGNLKSKSLNSYLKAIEEWIFSRQSKTVYGVNVSVLMEAVRDKTFAEILEKINLVHPAGMPIVWMMRELGATNQQRITDLDIFTALCESQQSHLKVFFLTYLPDILTVMAENLKTQFPQLQIVGLKCLDELSEKELIQEIERTQANLVAVFFQTPKQEVIWLSEHCHKIPAVMMGVGTVFQIYSGKYKSSPPYLQDIEIEGLCRLIEYFNECWDTYYQSIPDFIWQILTDRAALERRILKLFE